MDTESLMRQYFDSPPRQPSVVAGEKQQQPKKKRKLTRQDLMAIIQRHGISCEEIEESVPPPQPVFPPKPPPPPPPSSPLSPLLSFEQEMELSNAVASINPTQATTIPQPPPPLFTPTCGPQPSWAGCFFMCHACYFENTNNTVASPGGRVFITLSLCPRCAHVNCAVNNVIRKNEL